MLIKKKKLFVSHCSSDTLIMQQLTELLSSSFSSKNVTIFNTYNEKTGTEIGVGLSDTLRKNLTDSDLMIAVVTDNYMRSIKCVSELTAFWFLSHKVLPLVFNGTQGVDFINSLFGKELVYLEPDKLSADECAVKFFRTLQNYKFLVSISEKTFFERYKLFFGTAKQERSLRPYIGGKRSFEDIVLYCENNGIDRITDQTLELRVLIDNLRKFDDIYILATTGANLISGLATAFLEEALLSGKNLTVLLPNKDSAFCSDVAEIESPTDPEINLKRLSNAFDHVVTDLQRCVNAATDKAGNHPIGHVFIGCAYTLLRQTIMLGVSQTSYWGWLSVTVPPSKTNDKTPSFSFSGKNEATTFGRTILNHVLSIRQFAYKHGDLHEILPGAKKIENFFLEPRSAERYWKDIQAAANNDTLRHRVSGSGILIEVAANHPLRDGLYPSVEFSSRLDYAIHLYRHLVEQDAQVKIYVPGSRHRFETRIDKISLSEAGKEYLVERGIPITDILGDQENEAYKGTAGVYNSADECYVAAMIYQDQNFQKLCCVCSPNQISRKKLFYLAFGVMPDFYTVPGDNLAHDDVYEFLQAIPDVIYNDHTWQDPASKNGLRTRAERTPEIEPK